MPSIAAEKPPVEVVAGIIVRDARILIARRPDHAHMGGLWEFPGGKREPQETAGDALHRELQEELGIRIHGNDPFMTVLHHYPGKSVRIDFRLVAGFDGEPAGREGQSIAWVNLPALNDYDFPAANLPVVKALLERGLP